MSAPEAHTRARLLALQKVQAAEITYRDLLPAFFRSDQRRAKLLACGIMHCLSAEEALLLKEATEERGRE